MDRRALAWKNGGMIMARGEMELKGVLEGRKQGHMTQPLTPHAHRYEKEFENVQDVFELQRNLNNAFAYDLVPSPSVITAALKAARRVNDYPTAVRIFEGTSYNFTNTIAVWIGNLGYTRSNMFGRHQSQGREPGPIRRVPAGARGDPGRARRAAEGEPLPGAELVGGELQVARDREVGGERAK